MQRRMPDALRRTLTQKTLSIDGWAGDMQIHPAMLDPVGRGVDEVSQAIDARSSHIRQELADYIRGVRNRVDVD